MKKQRRAMVPFPVDDWCNEVVLSEENAAALCEVNWPGKSLQLGDQMSLGEFYFEKLGLYIF